VSKEKRKNMADADMLAAGPEEDADNSGEEMSGDANFVIVGKNPPKKLKTNTKLKFLISLKMV